MTWDKLIILSTSIVQGCSIGLILMCIAGLTQVFYNEFKKGVIMERSEAIKLVREEYCIDCHGSFKGKRLCKYEKSCDGFKKKVDEKQKN